MEIDELYNKAPKKKLALLCIGSDFSLWDSIGGKRPKHLIASVRQIKQKEFCSLLLCPQGSFNTDTHCDESPARIHRPKIRLATENNTAPFGQIKIVFANQIILGEMTENTTPTVLLGRK